MKYVNTFDLIPGDIVYLEESYKLVISAESKQARTQVPLHFIDPSWGVGPI